MTLQKGLFIMEKTLFQLLPKDLKPRERLNEFGAQALSNQELMAILLRTGTKNCSVMDISLHLLEMMGDLHEFASVSYEELLTIKGIGPSKALELLAAIELGKRIFKSKTVKGDTVHSSQWVGQYFIDEIGGLHQENVVALYLNTKNQIIKKEIVFKGSLSSSVAHPREIYRIGVRSSAARLIIGHNHPSGNPTPSEADYQFTERMAQAGEIIGIELLDHIIVGHDEFISLREEGVI